MAEMFLSVSCLVSPRKGEAPLSLQQNTRGREVHHLSEGRCRVKSHQSTCSVRRGGNEAFVMWGSLAGCRWWPRCSTCLLPVPAARSWRSPELKRQTDDGQRESLWKDLKNQQPSVQVDTSRHSKPQISQLLDSCARVREVWRMLGRRRSRTFPLIN